MAALLTSLGISIHAPREGGDSVSCRTCSMPWDFNPRPPRGGRRFVRIVSLSLPIISIHAPREGGDPEYGYVLGGCHGISIHAPREGGRLSSIWNDNLFNLKFQSPPPARGATPPHRCGHPSTQFQSTPPARGATKTRLLKIAKQKISIHAPREGGDIDFDAIKKGTMDISIHAPREGGDARD